MTLYSIIDGRTKLMFDGTYEDACDDFSTFAELMIKRLYAFGGSKSDVMQTGLAMVKNMQSIMQSLCDGEFDYLVEKQDSIHDDPDSSTKPSVDAVFPHTVVARVDMSSDDWKDNLSDTLSEILGRIADSLNYDDDDDDDDDEDWEF